MTETAFCLKCDEFREYRTKRYTQKSTHKGVKFEYESFGAFCTKCRTPIYVPWVEDMNVDSAERAYALAKEKEKVCR